MRKKSIKILSLLLTLALLVGVLPGMTAYADDTYTVTVTYGSTTILTMDDYELGLYLNIYGTQFSTIFTSFKTVSGTGIVANPTLWPTKTAFSFEVSALEMELFRAAMAPRADLCLIHLMLLVSRTFPPATP